MTMADILWTEEAELAYEHGVETTLAAGVWVVTYQQHDHERETFVFANEHLATTKALGFAIEIWDRFWEGDEDWPIQPERWDQIFEEVLNQAGECWDELTVEHKKILD